MEENYLESLFIGEDEYYRNLWRGNDRKWHSMFGFSKDVTNVVWNFLKTRSSSHNVFHIRYLLWFFYFLKNYSSDDVGADHFRVARETYEHWIWKVAGELADIHTIFIEDRFRGEKKDCYLIIDSTECPYERNVARSVQRYFYSGKKKHHTLKYELCVQIETGNICWISGPYYGKSADITIARASGILDQLEIMNTLCRILDILENLHFFVSSRAISLLLN